MIMFSKGKIILTMLFLATSEVISDPEDPKTSPKADEWHMDFVPSGYLPDSVYRELAWYGILQVQPLYRSAKHKVAAQWIWQNTLGRPYVIAESQPQSSQSDGTVSRQAIAEESAKWSRERRMAQDVLMENIRTGGNGLTVRTVVSETQRSVYIIQNGAYYECEVGSEPDVEAFRVQTNLHERMCTFGKQAEPRPVDPCIDAEAAPLEYSFLHGWMFCLGDGERDYTHSPNGDLDCGKKIKMRFNDFLRECAVDNNVVITFEYFGDEPRKDMVHNTTLCTSWDPCRVSHLYRIEVTEDEPARPSSTADPCDITLCPGCLEGGTEGSITADPVKSSDSLLISNPIQWIPADNFTISNLKNKAFIAGLLGRGHNLYLIRAPLNTSYGTEIIPGFFSDETNLGYIGSVEKEYRITTFEVAVLRGEFKWKPGGHSCDNMVVSGPGHRGYTNYVCRMPWKYDLKPGKYCKEYDACYVAHDGKQEKRSNEGFEVLCAPS